MSPGQGDDPQSSTGVGLSKLSKRLAINLRSSFNHSIQGEALRYGALGLYSEAIAFAFIRQQFRDCFRDCLNVSDWDQLARLISLNDLARAFRRSCYYGH